MHTAPFFFYVLLAGGAGTLLGLYTFFRRWREQRLIEDTPQARVRSAPQGYVKLSGHARSADGKPLHAPLTGRSCVWWTYRVERRERDGLFANSWSCTDSDTSERPFLLADEDQYCLVDPQGAEVEPNERRRWPGSRYKFDQNCRYMEAILAEDTPLCILGELRANHGSVTNTIDEEAAALLSQWKQDQPALLKRFDANHDGHIDAAEWEVARAAAVAQAQHNKVHEPPGVRVNVLAKPGGSQPFVIAECSVGQLAHLEQWRARAGLALTLLSLVAIGYALAHIRAEDASAAAQAVVTER
ncbi:MAG TPA: GIDE domain-containing protein [Steroidobacteraceae bacterium]